MICISIGDKDVDKCQSYLEKVEMAEIRLDLTEFTVQDIERVFSCGKKLIATCRPGKFSDPERAELLKIAVKAGATYMDIEYESPADYRNDLLGYARKYKSDVIISYHNHECTPSLEDLEKIMNECFAMGADVAKIATMVRSTGIIQRSSPCIRLRDVWWRSVWENWVKSAGSLLLSWVPSLLLQHWMRARQQHPVRSDIQNSTNSL